MDLTELHQLPAHDRAVTASRIATELQQRALQIAAIRLAAMRELLDAGMTRIELARLLGISRQRVSQLLDAHHRDETRAGG